MLSDQEVSYKIVVGESFHRVEESPILEVEKPTFGSLQLMKRGSAPQTEQLDLGGWVMGHPPEFS